MSSASSRMRREKATVAAMVEIFCHDQHRSAGSLCGECSELLDYAFGKLEKCPFQESKPTCAKCLVHCYRPQVRERVRTVMRYAGPRMLWHHPLLSLLHFLDELRRRPPSPRNRGGKLMKESGQGHQRPERESAQTR